MAFFDFPLEKLKTYKPERVEAPDFDAFWRNTLAEARKFPLEARFDAADFKLQTIETYDVTFNGFGGQPIKAWLLLPHQRTGKLPCVVEYIGYGGGRSFPTQWLPFANAGFAHFIMDTRGQGSNWQNGDTPDIADSNPNFPGFMTRGILDPQTYYYRRLFTDGVRAVEAARAHPAVDGERIAVTGVSQGGGITIAVSGLEPAVKASLPDVPFLCAYRRATQITNNLPYGEIASYCKAHREKVEQVFHTLSYFDGVNFAPRAKAPAYFSTALMDDTCPPSTVFAAYNHYAGPKQIKVYEYNYHDGGGPYQVVEKIKYLQALWKI